MGVFASRCEERHHQTSRLWSNEGRITVASRSRQAQRGAAVGTIHTVGGEAFATTGRRAAEGGRRDTLGTTPRRTSVPNPKFA
jgi:hypothetical protein